MFRVYHFATLVEPKTGIEPVFEVSLKLTAVINYILKSIK